MTKRLRSTAIASSKGRIDTHHHFFPPSIPELAPEFSAVAPNVSFQFPSRIEDHLTFMDTAGVQTAIVSPSIKKEWGCDWPAAKFLALCEDAFEAALDMVKANPLRFGSFAMLPFPHVPESLQMVQKASSAELPADGYAIATSNGSKYIGDPSFDPVWAALNEIDGVVFVHPSDTVMPPNLSFPPFMMEYPFDTTRAMTSLITSGVLTRFPRVKFLFAHLGGAFPFLVDRMMPLSAAVAKANAGSNLKELIATANIYIDTAISSPPQYKVLKEIGFPMAHTIHATDFPYTGAFRDVYMGGITSPEKSGIYTKDEVATQIARENALTILFPRLKKEYEREWA